MWDLYKSFLNNSYKNEILEIMADEDTYKHFPLCIKYINLFDIGNGNFGNELLKTPTKVINRSDQCLQEIQRQLLVEIPDKQLSVKIVHTRFYELPGCPEIHRTKLPTNDDVGSLLQIVGTVIRVTSRKVLEYQRNYMCVKCKYEFMLQADYYRKYIIVPPKKCGNADTCKGTKFIPLSNNIVPENCRDYQEIKIQEKIGKSVSGSMTSSMWVTVENDLVDNCKPGDDVTICGIVKRRFSSLVLGKKYDVELAVKAYHVQINNEQHIPKIITKDIRDYFENFWVKYKSEPLVGRDIILKSFCPQIFGLYAVKLAMAIVLAGGSNLKIAEDDDNWSRVRSQSHLLLVGDPGTGKSQLLKFASSVIPRSVLTTGIGSTSAGLTVTAVKEGGEWQLEAGALVLADGGIACIDEFNSMKEQDRLSIHEAMEQQTISVAKAGIVCKLSTRCSIIAATNPKGKIDPDQPLTVNTGLASPLLSRFDLVFITRDKVDREWDELVADYILNGCNIIEEIDEETNWSLDNLQLYFNIIKQFQPALTEEANTVLRSYYQFQRRDPSRNKARTTVRLLDSLVRLSQGHARLMYRNEVSVLDAVIAVFLLELSMYDDSSLISKHSNNIHSIFPSNSTLHYCQIAKTILKRLNLMNILKEELNKNINFKTVVPKSTLQKSQESIVSTNSSLHSSSFSIEDKPEFQNKQSIYENNDLIYSNVVKINENKGKQNVDLSLNNVLVTSTPNKLENSYEKNVFSSKNEDILYKNNSNSKFHLDETKIHDPLKTKRKRKQKTENNKQSKQRKTKHCNEIDLLNTIPSVNDDIFYCNVDSEFEAENYKQTQMINEIEPPTKLNKFKYVLKKKCPIDDFTLGTKCLVEKSHFKKRNECFENSYEFQDYDSNKNTKKENIIGHTKNRAEISTTNCNNTVQIDAPKCSNNFAKFKFKKRDQSKLSIQSNTTNSENDSYRTNNNSNESLEQIAEKRDNCKNNVQPRIQESSLVCSIKGQKPNTLKHEKQLIHFDQYSQKSTFEDSDFDFDEVLNM